MKHRGPDAHGEQAFDIGHLIHTRLKVIDVSAAGAQPMPSADRSVWVVFNGEIYNHRELRRSLEGRGHRFQGHCDTEVIPALYLEHGDQFVEHLRGMFALAVLDLRRKRLVLARDRFGIKPLFFAPVMDQSALAFASELDALRQVPGIDFSVNAQAAHDFIALHYIPPPQTIYRGVSAVEPGTCVIAQLYEAGVRTEIRRYHRFRIAPDHSVTAEVVSERVASLVDAAVSAQLESDVPLGGLLSGGIDSALVCEAANRASPNKLRTFGMRFDDPGYDEGSAIASAAQEIGSDHTMLRFGVEPPSWDSLVQVLRRPGQPFGDTSLFAATELCRHVRKEVTVALSGDGGDEPFAGYDHHGRLRLLNASLMVPDSARAAALRALAAGSRPFAGRSAVPRHLPMRLEEAANARGAVGVVADLSVWVRRRELAHLWRGPSVEPVERLFEPTWERDLPSLAAGVESLHATLTEADTRLRLAGDYLPKVDAASMGASLEVRVPLLDEKLFDYALTIPFHLKRTRREGKRPLRALARRRVPSVATLPKWGFGVPVDRWLGGSVRRELRDQLLDRGATIAEFIDQEAVAPALHAFADDQAFAGASRIGTYQRVISLFALDIGLGLCSTGDSR